MLTNILLYLNMLICEFPWYLC